MTLLRPLFAVFGVVMLFSSLAQAADDPSAAQEVKPRYKLEYKFQAGETLWHDVEHVATSDTSVNGSRQATETTTQSVKVWQVTEVTPDGAVTFVHSLNNMHMRTKISGRAEVSYDSARDAQPPKGYEDAAKSVGVPLVELTIDPTGKIIARDVKSKAVSPDIGTQLVTPLPGEPIAVGETWKNACDFDVTLEGGGLKRIKARQLYELKKVKDNIAEIAVETQILTPLDNPKLEVQTMQRLSKGQILFDLAKGRVVQHNLTWDQRVIGFAGPQSALKFEATFVEKLTPAGDRQVRREPAYVEPATRTK